MPRLVRYSAQFLAKARSLFPPDGSPTAVLLTDGTVEIIDLEVDEDYWDLTTDDPGN